MSYPEVNTSNAPLGSVFDLSLNAFIDLYDDASVRLHNGIRYGASEGRLPYPSLRAYLEAGSERIEHMLRLPALGRKSVHEFEELARRAAAEFRFDAMCVESVGAAPVDASVGAAVIPAIFEISLDSFLAQQPTVSPRLVRAVRAGIHSGDCPFHTVSAYLEAGHQRLALLCKLPNLGATSAQEFDRLVQDAVRHGAIVPPSPLALNAQGFPDLEGLMNSVFDALDERQTKLLLDRIESEATLDTIARNLGVSRARIYQIERKMIAQLVAKFSQAFLQALAAIEAECQRRGLRETTLHAFAKLAGSDVVTCGLYFKCLKRFAIDAAETLALHDRIHLYRPAGFAPSDTWDQRVDQALVVAHWPLVLKDFLVQVPDVPSFHVQRRLCERYQAEIVDGAFTQQPRISARKMCLQVLAAARTPLRLADIRAGVLKHFRVDLTMQHITSTVSANGEITICGWGTYARYADLPYSNERIKDVCDRLYDALAARQVFVSSKILFERLFAADIAQYPAGFNHYLLLGFAQDDNRFIVKRGNMIGLAGFDVSKTHMSLEDKVCAIVLEHGPIDVAGIIARMADTRELCNGTYVRLTLAKSADVIRVGRRIYDSVDRFFSDREEYDVLVLALRIALLSGTKSVYALADEMAALGLGKASTEVIGSLLTTADDVTQVNGMYHLSAPETDLQRYQAIALASLADGGLERLRQEADAAFGSDTAARFIRVDRRFQANPSPRRNDTVGSELHAILADFEF